MTVNELSKVLEAMIAQGNGGVDVCSYWSMGSTFRRELIVSAYRYNNCNYVDGRDKKIGTILSLESR